MVRPLKILIVEDDPDVVLLYATILHERGHEVIIVRDGEEALNAYREGSKEQEMGGEDGSKPPFDVVVLDYRMPKMNGFEVATEILGRVPDQRIMFVSAYVKETLADAVKELNRAVELLQKPVEIDTLVRAIEDENTYRELEKLNTKLKSLRGSLTHDQLNDLLSAMKDIQKKRK